MSNHAAAMDTLRALLEPFLSTDGFELVDVTLQGSTLQVLVERLEGRIDLDGVAVATRLVDAALDADDPIAGSYTLEVSSPGLERPLRTPAHFARFVGQVINVKTKPGVDGDRRVEGRLDSTTDDGIVVAGRRVAYDEIDRARTVFVFGGQPKPGGPKGKKGALPPVARTLDVAPLDKDDKMLAVGVDVDENFDDENFDDENFDDENFDDEDLDDENFDDEDLDHADFDDVDDVDHDAHADDADEVDTPQHNTAQHNTPQLNKPTTEENT